MKIFNSTKSWPEKVYKPYSSSEKHSSQINTTILHIMQPKHALDVFLQRVNVSLDCYQERVKCIYFLIPGTRNIVW